MVCATTASLFTRGTLRASWAVSMMIPLLPATPIWASISGWSLSPTMAMRSAVLVAFLITVCSLSTMGHAASMTSTPRSVSAAFLSGEMPWARTMAMSPGCSFGSLMSWTIPIPRLVRASMTWGLWMICPSVYIFFPGSFCRTLKVISMALRTPKQKPAWRAMVIFIVRPFSLHG